jgi:alkaline phosphatase D
MKFLAIILSFLTTIVGYSQKSRPEVPQQQDILAPFYHGVASGDPLPNAVIIWTRFTPDSEQLQAVKLQYTIATDTAFQNIVQQGEVFADPLNDFTAKVDVKHLNPNTYYYYVFTAPTGKNSLIGRTKTAPTGHYSHFRAASLSCTSIYSGFFNGYARIAERNDLDLVIHVGDYLYDFVDRNGNNRVPDPYPETPKDLQSWRDRHDYYDLDVDLIRARQQHPFVIIWDNHDVDDYHKNAVSYKAANRAFYEWLPIRLKQDELVDTLKIYQKLEYGDLVDVVMLDCYSYKDDEVGTNANNFNNDEIGDENRSYLGDKQREWLYQQIDSSSTVWRIFGSQKLMAPWCLGCFPDITGDLDFPVFNDNGNVFNVRAWDGYPAERKNLFNKLREKGSRNNLTLSGDAHLAFYADLTEDPFNLIEYNPLTGGQSVGVELLPSSLTRENFDEILAAEGGGKPNSAYYSAAETLAIASRAANIHHKYSNFSDHGYALIDITPERIIGEFWVSEKIEVQSTETMMRSHTCEANSGVWSVLPNLTPSDGKTFQANPAPLLPPTANIVGITQQNPNAFEASIYPNPASEGISIILPLNHASWTIELLDVRSVVLQSERVENEKQAKFTFASNYTAGTYFVRISSQGQQFIQKISIQ